MLKTKFKFFIQGSAPNPYGLELSIDPVTISCNCQAAIMGIPCKHRLSVLNGNTSEIIGLTPDIAEAVSIVSKIIKQSDIPRYMKEYEDAKNNAKSKNEKADKLFKKYREAIIANALNKGTEKQIKKASADLDAVIQDCVNAAVERESLIKALQTIFVRPDFA
jgi:hypothetical protein